MKQVVKRSTAGNWETRIVEEARETNNGIKVTYRVTRLNTQKLGHYGDFISREYVNLSTAEKKFEALA